jgi:hypothetical protein
MINLILKLIIFKKAIFLFNKIKISKLKVFNKCIYKLIMIHNNIKK